MKRIVKITAALLLGALIGFLAVFAQFDVAILSALSAIEQFLTANAYINFMFAAVVVPVVMIVLSRIGIAKYRKSIECEREHEDDFLLSVILAISSIDIILMLALFCIFSVVIENEEFYTGFYSLISAVFGCFANLLVMSNIINEIKKYDPLKKGNLEDLNFNKQWLESLDERERTISFEAGFKAYKAMGYASVALILLAGANCYIQHGSLLSIVFISIIPIVGIIIYYINAYKLGKKG